MKELLENIRFKTGIEIIKKYESNPLIYECIMEDTEFYIGDMNIWRNIITKDDINKLEELGFMYYEEAECFLFKLNFFK